MTIAEFKQELIDKRSYFYQFPWPATTYGHWSAGRYFTTFNDYHFNVDGDGEIIYTRPQTTTDTGYTAESLTADGI